VQAVAAEILGEQTRVKDQYFLAGLLTDLGRLAMLKVIGRDYLPVLEMAESSECDLIELEQAAFGFDSVDIGTKLMARWKLPEPLIQAASVRKWSVEELEARISQGHRELLTVVAVATAVGEYFCTSNKGPALERMKVLTSRHFGMDRKRLDEFLDQVKQRVDEAAGTFALNPHDLCDPIELMSQANEHLARLALREHVTSTQAQERQRLAEEYSEKLLKENQQLQKKALHDPLTKIYNRHYFEDALMREIHRCERTADPVGVIFSDIDRFKNLNDTYGHPFGDQVLQEVARLFQEALRTSDVLARYGGEEFVVLAVHPTEKGLEKLAERVRANVAEHGFFFEGRRVAVTVSVGAAIKIPRRNSETAGENLIAAADEAMYESKRKGRNRVTIHSLLHDEERRLVQLVNQRRFSRWLVNRRVLDIPTASKALVNCHTPRICVGVLACQAGCLDRPDVDRILERQNVTNERFGEAAQGLELLTEAQLAQLLAWQAEDPKALAHELVKSGILTLPDVDMLLDQYLAETSLRRKPFSEMELASFA
jgi:diguanylate cyclase (GGDEF)-like protein